MRPGAVLGEACRDVATRTARATLLALVLGVALSAACLLDLLTTVALQQRAARWAASGAAVHVLAAEHAVDGESCAALTAARGAARAPVASAGALAAGPTLTFDATPASSLPSFAVTPSLAAVLGLTSPPGEGVWVSDQLATTLTAGVGDRLATDRGPLRVAAVFPWPDDGRDQRLAFAVLVPSTGPARYDECWATITPGNPAAVDLLRTAHATPLSTSPAPVALLNHTLGQELDARAQHEGRATRHVAVLVPLLGLVLGVVATRLRRLEHASALHAGVGRWPLSSIAVLESLAWAVPAVAVAAAAVALTGLHLTDAANAVDLLAGQVPALLAVLVTGPLGVLAALAVTDERHLAAYAKER